MQTELLALEKRKEQLYKSVKETQPALVRLRPDLAELYRKKVDGLAAELNHESVRAEAADILRGLIQEIKLAPEHGQLEIELVGEAGAILILANEAVGKAAPARAKITMVAGEGLEPPTRGL